MIRSLLLTLTLALLAAAPASAQTPLDLGAGKDPSIAVDAAGTAHIVFDGQDGDVYCRLPRAAAACDVSAFLPLPRGTGVPAIFDRPDGSLLIVRATDETNADGTLKGTSTFRVSSDRGLTWSAPVAFATGSDDFDKVVLAPGGQSVFTLDTRIDFSTFQSAPLAGGEARTMHLYDPLEHSAFADVAALPDGRVLSIVGDLKNVQWALFGGGDLLDLTAWATRGTLRNIFDAELVTGPRGTFLLDHRAAGDQRVRPFKASYSFRELDPQRLRWRAGRTAGEDRFILGFSTAVQDASGRLHVIGDTGSSPACIVYSRTGPRRSSWFGKSTVLFKTSVFERKPARIRIGAAPDGRGFAVWQDQTNVRVLPLRQARGAYTPLRRTPHRPICR